MNQAYRHIIALLCCIWIAQGSYAQCPPVEWDAMNIGNAYIEEVGKKTYFGDFTNTRSAQFVNDGHLYFLGNIDNNGYFGDGMGYEFIKSCDNETTTVISGTGATEFNIVDIDNPADVDLNKDIRIKANLHFRNGIIHTDRREFRQRVFFIEGATHSGSSSARHVDGTIARQGQGPFIYPLGDGDHMAQLKAVGSNAFDIFVATYHSILQSDDQYYAMGEFPVEAKDDDVALVQPKEFWTLAGGQSTKITLFWSGFSEINNLTSDINDLIVVGWDGEKWVNLGNTGVEFFFGTGSVTSTSVVPNRYEAFTIAVSDTDGDGVADSEDPDPNDPCTPDPTSDACTGRVCIDVQVAVFIEGALQGSTIGEYSDIMTSKLIGNGYLPGQRPSTFLGTRTPAGQPYNEAPWNYAGQEGLEFDAYSNDNIELYPADAIDWVLVSIRSGTSKESTVCTKAALLTETGEVVMTDLFDCCEIEADDYYVVIEHRNHLPVMTPTKVPLVNNTLSFDFRESESYIRLLGYGQKEISPGVYAMYAGNGDQVLAPESPADINAKDISLWTLDNGRHSGYYQQDYDLNGDVNVHDKALWLLNNGVFSDVDQ